jgi:hypothetical protein
MQYPEMAAYTGAGKCSIALISVCPISENSHAPGPDKAAISPRSAPAEKNLRFPVTIQGSGVRVSSRTPSVSARTQARVSRFVSSPDRKRSTRIPACRSRRKNSAVST